MEKIDLDRLLSSLSINEMEGRKTFITAEDSAAGTAGCRRSLIGKFISNKEIVVLNMKDAMEKSWKSTAFTVQKIGHNTFQIFFEKEADQKRVLREAPWCFNNSLLILHKWNPSCKPLEMSFDTTPYWIHIYGLPPELYTDEVGRKIARDINNCTSLQLREENVTNRRFFRLRMELQIAQPVRRFVTLLHMNHMQRQEEIRGLIQYERLPNMCFHCGLVTHTVSGCSDITDEISRDRAENFQYGTWLHAKRSSSLIREIDLKIMEETHEAEADLDGDLEGAEQIETMMILDSSPFEGQEQRKDRHTASLIPISCLSKTLQASLNDTTVKEQQSMINNPHSTLVDEAQLVDVALYAMETQDTVATPAKELFGLTRQTKTKRHPRKLAARGVLGDITNVEKCSEAGKRKHVQETLPTVKKGKKSLAEAVMQPRQEP